jgi:long-chain fatty acid transport protein
VGFGYSGSLGSAEYEDNWVGRYCNEGPAAGLTLMPSVAYRLSDKISFGAGLNAMYGMLDTKMAEQTGTRESDSSRRLHGA